MGDLVVSKSTDDVTIESALERTLTEEELKLTDGGSADGSNTDNEGGTTLKTIPENSQVPINVSTPCIGAVLDSTVAYAENMDSQKINHSSTENTDELDNDIEIVTFEEVDQATQTSCYDVPEKTNYSHIATPSKGNLTNLSLQRKTPLLKRTRAGRTRDKAAKLVQDSDKKKGENRDEIVILRAENAVLKTAIQNLEHTISEQNSALTGFRAELKFLTLEMRKMKETTEASDAKTSLLLEDQESKCIKRCNETMLESQRKRDRLSSKIDQIQKHKCTEMDTDTWDNKLCSLQKTLKQETKKISAEVNEAICNIQTDVERIEHEVAGISQKTKAPVLESGSIAEAASTDIGPRGPQLNQVGPNSLVFGPTSTELQFAHQPRFIQQPIMDAIRQPVNNYSIPQNQMQHSQPGRAALPPLQSRPPPPPKNQPLQKLPQALQQGKEPSLNMRGEQDVVDTVQDINQNGESNLKLEKTLLVMDSNKQYLTDELWKNSRMLFCATAGELLTKSPDLIREHQPDVVLIHTGTNDLDHRDGATVARTLAHIAQKMRKEHPHLKIIVSEVTPRRYYKDDQVKICNEQLENLLKPMDNVTLAFHSNLRTPDWRFYRDDKHIDASAVRKFAANLKTALRKAIGIPERPRDGRKKPPRMQNVEELRMKLLEVLGGK